MCLVGSLMDCLVSWFVAVVGFGYCVVGCCNLGFLLSFLDFCFLCLL